MSECNSGCWKGILPTPAPSKIPKITHREDTVDRPEAFEETDWEHCGQGTEQKARAGVGMDRKLCHGENSSEGHRPKRLSTARQI